VIAVDDRGIVAVARYARDETDPTTAEVAILVADEWQHRGVARELMRPLMARARDAGIRRFRAEILPEDKTEALPWRSRADNPRTNVRRQRGHHRPLGRCPPEAIAAASVRRANFRFAPSPLR